MTEISPERDTATKWPALCCTVLMLLNLTVPVVFTDTLSTAAAREADMVRPV